jgi:hypothetical protein
MADTARGAARAAGVYANCRDEVLRMAPWTCCFKREWLYDTAKQATPWTALHHYGVGERCTNDTDKTYQCVSEGRSAAATGPTGTGTAIADGTVEWNYIEASSASTNWCHWPSTAYKVGELCSWDTGKIYRCAQAGTTASANPPIGTVADIVDGTVRWAYYATIPANRTLYAYQFVLPFDCVRVIKVPLLSAAKESQQGAQYTVEGRFLYTDQAESFLRYVYRAEVAEWDPLLQGTVALRIAAEIAFDVTGQQSLMKLAFQALAGQYAGARQIAMGEAQEGAEEVVGWEDV